MGIYSSTSPNDMKYWLIDELSTELAIILNIFSFMLNSTKWNEEEKSRYIKEFRRYFSSATQLLNFAYERKCWTEDVVDFIMKNGLDGLNAYIKLLSENKPATEENLEKTITEIKARTIKELCITIDDGFIIIKRSFNDIIVERYSKNKEFVSSVIINSYSGTRFEKKGGIQKILEDMRISSPADKEKTLKVFFYLEQYISGKLQWGELVKELTSGI